MPMWLLVILSPFLIIHHTLCSLMPYRWLLGGHWERWCVDWPVCGDMWIRMKPEECYRMTGKHPGGLIRGRPYCEEGGWDAYDNATYCKCGRDLTRAPGVVGSYEDEEKNVFSYSCPCGCWPRFLFGPPTAVYLGDSRDDSGEPSQ